MIIALCWRNGSRDHRDQTPKAPKPPSVDASR